LFLFYQEKRKEKISIKILFSCLILICSSQKVSAESLGKYKNIEQKLSTGQLALAQSLIAAFSPTTNIENNYKTFYTLQRAYLQNQDLTLIENIQLLLLAYQCPFTDGQVVYSARALYNQVNQTVVVYSDYNCANKGFSFRTAGDSTNTQLNADENLLLSQLISNEKETKAKFKFKSDYKLVPNPANNFVSIISTNESENLQVVITDVNGKILKTINVVTEQYSATINFNLLDGVYFVNIINESGEKTVKKLVVAK
jgi:hypothetical protein